MLVPDSGRGYLSKLYNDGWMADFGFLRGVGQSVAEVLGAKGHNLPPLVHVHPDESVREVIGILREFSISQVPVLKAEPPVAVAEILGSVQERTLLQAAFHDPSLLDRPIGDVMGPPLLSVGMGEPLELAVTRMEAAGAVIVLDAGHPIGILTRSDVLEGLVTRSVEQIAPRGDRDGEPGFETRAIHAGQEPDPVTGSVIPAIHLATTFRQRAVGEHAGYEYSRSGNPTRASLETQLASLEGAQFGFAFASGLAAEDAVLRAVLRPGDHVILPGDAYGGTFRLIDRVLGRTGISNSSIDLSEPERLASAWRPEDARRVDRDAEQSETRDR